MNIGNIGPRLLLSLHAQPMQWHVAIGELCDNSFDAAATRIEIIFSAGKTVELIDDGLGCDNVQKMLTLGEHYRQPTTSLGRFGVGLKEAACWLWGHLHLITNHKGTIRKADINWPELSKKDTWDVADPIETVAKPGEPLGTRLEFRHIQRAYPDFEKLACALSYYFSPALRSGRQIVIRTQRRKPIVCVAWAPPDLEDIVQDRFEINGKRVKLTAGIIPMDARTDRPGFSIAHGHRVITNSAFGSKGNSVSRICGIVELDSAWTLSKNKTDLVDADQHLLEDAIFERCKGIIEKSASQAEVLRNTELEARVSDSLRVILGQRRKAKRNPPENESGAIEQKDTKRKQRKASKCQPGESLLDACKAGQIRMEWEAKSDGHIGRVDLLGNVIFLNSEHERLAHHRQSENADALVDMCMMLLSHEAVDREQRDKLPFARDAEGFIDALSSVLRAQQITDNALELAKK